MIYIIDANNLAGQMGILFEEGFDKIMVNYIKEHFAGKKMRICLVFDSNEPMGDKYQEENIEVIYTPRDSYYRSADDKVLELVTREIANGIGNGQISVVTDDIDLSEAVKKSADKKNYNLTIIKARDFAKKIQSKKNILEACDDRNISKRQEDKITDELLKLWGEK